MMQPNHEFFCSVALSPRFRNWVVMTCNMQEAVGLVFLPRARACVCVCVCVCVCWLYHFYQVSRLSPYRPHWRPRVGSLTPS